MKYTKRSTREILEMNRERPVPGHMEGIVVWLHNIRSMHNVGSVFRTCDAFGVGRLLLSGYTPYPPRPEISKTALGADETVPWQHVDSVEECIPLVKGDGYRLIGIEQAHQGKLLTDFKLMAPTKTCLVFGNEVTGLDDAILAGLDDCVEIPQFGQKHSLNVSVAAGVVLYHMLLMG